MVYSLTLMSEELIKRGLIEHGLIVGNYEFYNIGDTTLNQLKKYKVIPNKDYKEYGSRQPDGLLVDRRNKENIKVILVIENKDNGKFKSEKDKINTIEQCNDVCQVLSADIGIASDNSSYIWFNPNQKDDTSPAVKEMLMKTAQKNRKVKTNNLTKNY